MLVFWAISDAHLVTSMLAMFSEDFIASVDFFEPTSCSMGFIDSR